MTHGASSHSPLGALPKDLFGVMSEQNIKAPADNDHLLNKSQSSHHDRSFECNHRPTTRFRPDRTTMRLAKIRMPLQRSRNGK